MKRILVLTVIVVVLVGATIALAANPASLYLPIEVEAEVDDFVSVPTLFVSFSEAGHFFDGDITVSIYASNPHAEIYYTLNGAFPTTTSSIYSEPLTFTARRDTNVFVLRAKAVYGDEVSDIMTHTFFVGEDVHDRFTTIVFSVNTNRNYLYDFRTGIFVEGLTRQVYRESSPRSNIQPTSPANFNWRGRESERPVHVEAFYADGERVLTQLAGMRVFGSWSRAEPVKSIRLIARREYSPDAGRFHYQFFPCDFVQDGFGDTPVHAYNTLILRNGGNDRNHGILRNELGSVLARRAGFMDVTPVRAAALFINGRYYGYMWLQTRFDEHYLQELYRTPTRDFDVVGRGEWWFRNATDEQVEALTYKNNFANRNLNNEAEWAALNEIVCVDNLLWYYAFQIFLGNGDWPGNNVRRWRYTGEPFDGMAPELDGRWRYAIFDLDQTFGLFGQDYRRPTFQEVLTWDNGNGQLIRNILTRPDMAERFTMMFNDIAANVVNYAIVSEVMGELWNDIAPEVGHTIEAGRLIADWTSFNTIARYHESTLNFARRRHIYINESLARLFRVEQDFFNVTVSGGEAVIGTQRAASSRYFAHLTIPVTPVLPEFTAFDHWLVNGARVNSERLYVDEYDAIGGTVRIELVTRPDLPPLMIYHAHTSTGANGLVLVNPTDRAIRTDGLFLSNRRYELDRFAIPAATVEPGGTLEFAGRGSASHEDLFRIQMNFNVREGRRVFLSDGDGNIIDTIILHG